MKKKFVLDTNVLLHDPRAIDKFDDETVIIPIYVIEEIDRFKRELSERGRNAREISRALDAKRQDGNLADGVPTESGGLLRVSILQSTENLTGIPIDSPSADDLILGSALQVREQAKKSGEECAVILVTRDVNLRIRADAVGVTSVDYLDEKIERDDLDEPSNTILTDQKHIDQLYENNMLKWEQRTEDAGGEKTTLVANQLVILQSSENQNHRAPARYFADESCLKPLGKLKRGVFGIKPRNLEQHFALDLLLDDSVNLVTMIGKAGTGKTLLAIAAALQQTVEEHKYRKTLVSRPVFPIGKDIGYLPGDIEEKLNPWMKPIFDNLEFLLGGSSEEAKSAEQSYYQLFEMGHIEIEPLTYIRGRSLPHQYLIVDEAQNLTPHEVKTIITRAGDHTKIVLCGDVNQIDNPYVDALNNGLATVVKKFKGQTVAGHCLLSKGERSPLAELASNLL